MSIWLKPYTVDDLNSISKNIVTLLGIEFTEIGEDWLAATMPVDERTQMPLGLLHGGASCVLAETVGSTASFMTIDPSYQRTAGLEINASHLRGVSSGVVTAVARPYRIGRRNQVWEIKITSDEGKLVCASRLTMAIVEQLRQ